MTAGGAVVLTSPFAGWLSLDLARDVGELTPIIVFSCKRARSEEKEKGAHGACSAVVTIQCSLQPHTSDKDTARQVTAPVDQKPSEFFASRRRLEWNNHGGGFGSKG
ncbi:hypothetical protein V8C37DRAFT_399709 [Trichoderma ceciliae]